ncbi:MAG: DUF362 domain-containing protein [Candidatus Bathyarchaeia archaeon]
MKINSFGSVTVGRVRDAAHLRSLLEDRLPESGVYLVKPNWYSPHPANYTDCRVMEMLFEALDGKIVVIEGYSLDRQDGSMSFTVDGEEVDWGWLMRHPNWSWIREEERWEEMRRQDEWFLEEHGFSELFSQYSVEYVNVTEEIWRERVVDPMLVKREVEERFTPAAYDRMYSFMPEAIYDYRDSPLISLGKMKGAGTDMPSLSIKNMFGLVPDPLRSWWHGPKNIRLAQSITDITKLYASFFKLFGICEAIHSITVADPEGDIEVPWGRFRMVEHPCLAACGSDLVELDAVLCSLMRVKPEDVKYIQAAEDVLGRYEQRAVREAESQAGRWLQLN